MIIFILEIIVLIANLNFFLILAKIVGVKMSEGEGGLGHEPLLA